MSVEAQTVHPIVINYSCVKDSTGVYKLTCLNCPAPYPICNSLGDAQQFQMSCDNCCGGLSAIFGPDGHPRPPMGRENPEAVSYYKNLNAVNPNKIFTCDDGTEHTFSNSTQARMICPPRQ